MAAGVCPDWTDIDCVGTRLLPPSSCFRRQKIGRFFFSVCMVDTRFLSYAWFRRKHNFRPSTMVLRKLTAWFTPKPMVQSPSRGPKLSFDMRQVGVVDLELVDNAGLAEHRLGDFRA